MYSYIGLSLSENMYFWNVAKIIYRVCSSLSGALAASAQGGVGDFFLGSVYLSGRA